MSVVNGFVWIGAINLMWQSLEIRLFLTGISIIFIVYFIIHISYRYKSRMDRLKIPELEHQIKDAENENDSVAYSPP